MAVSSIPLGNPTEVTADGEISSHPGRLIAVQLSGGTTASSMVFHNDSDATDATKILYSIVAPCKTGTASEAASVLVKLPGEGILFDTECYVDWTGTLAVGWVWFR